MADNIQNLNTEAAKKRTVTIKLEFTPNKNRDLVKTSVKVATTLAQTEALETQFVMGVDARTGEIGMAEYDSQVRGQMTINDYDVETDQEMADNVAVVDLRQKNENTNKNIISLRKVNEN